MSMDIDQANTTTAQKLGFQLKGGLFTLTTLQIHSTDLEQLRTQLQHKIQQAPNFFQHTPLVLDIRLKSAETNLDFNLLKALLKELKMIPVGVKINDPSLSRTAQQHGFAILRDSTEAKAITANEPAKDAEEVKERVIKPASKARIITQPVRSGQQIYVPDGDLIIINQVSPGAELIADGSIHVYGALRGRALAGVNGDTQARIFCKSLEAELVSVAGNYKISEDIERQAWKVAAQVYIKDDRLQISEL